MSQVVDLIDPHNVESIEMFTRDSPRCHFCMEAKQWLLQHISHAPVTEYNIGRDSDKWRDFLNKYPSARTIPQITVTMKNKSRIHIGGYYELLKAFSAQMGGA